MNELKHYGTPRHSGRYPWGSGDNPYQSALSFVGMISEMRKKGMSEVEIAKGMGISTSTLRARNSLAKAELRAQNAAQALRLKDKGYSNVEIGRRMGINESSVRNLLDPAMKDRASIVQATSNALRESISKNRYIDIGAGVENHLGVSRTKLNTSIAELVEQGYKIHYVKVEQLGVPGQYTSVKVLGAPDTTYSEVFKNKTLIQPIVGKSSDYGRTYSNLGMKPIDSISSSKVAVRYYEDGGADKDGVIELRRGAEGLDLGNSKYAQVRIGVDGTHYLKGMAIYSDDLPDGVDILFNTNKHVGTPMIGAKDNSVLKIMKDDPDNPFGSTIKVDGQRGKLNIVSEEGDWGNWGKTISSQMLSKQAPSLAKQQLDIYRIQKQEEHDEIMALTNPTVKKHLLTEFADSCDASAAHLEAAGMPRQGWHVILPVTKSKETEIYAPNYKDGESVVLIRYPHGGTFEIPQLTVNNRNPSARRIMENAKDAVGIHPNVAKKLSGADFDGDTVLVIPNNKGLIKSTASLKEFDPVESYPAYEGMPRTGGKGSGFNKQMQMGSVSNLVTDMTIKGATINEISRAVRHSMVVIDAEKHNLNYKQSYIDNGIAQLKEKYQGGANKGASTLISRAEGRYDVPERKEGALIGPVSNKTGRMTRVYIDPATGSKLYTPTDTVYTNKKGKEVIRTTRSTKIAETDDAFTLSAGTTMESVYASHSNSLKALANQSRKETLAITSTPYSPSAKTVYSEEVATLNAKLNIAIKNKPLERQAQIVANNVVATKVKDNPGMDQATLKKIRGQALTEARVRVGAKKQRIDITDKEWEAIQAGAISTNKLTQILDNSDSDVVKRLATPRNVNGLTSGQVARARSMLKLGLTQAEVAEALGVSSTTLNKFLT